MIPLELLFIPFIGGIIGYSTNWIAIKMLFRPKEAKYFFKIRIPFTPGILPKSKEKLAKKISYTTFHHILSHPILKEKIELKFIEIEHFFTEKLKTIIDNSNPITFYEIIPNRFYPLFIELYSKLNKEFNTVVLSYISSENLLKIFKKDDTFYSKIKVLYFILDNLIDRFNQINFKEYFQKEAKKSKKSISHFLPNSIFIDIKSFLMENYPLLNPFLKNIIISNKLDKKLEEIMEKLILKYLEDSLTSTQKIFSNLFRIEAEIKKKIPEFVQEFLSNLFNTLNEDQIKNHIIDQILDILKNIIDKPFDTFEENIIDNFFQNYIFTFEKKIKYSLIESKNRRRLIFILIRNFFNQNIILKNKQDLNDLISTLFKKKIHYWIFKKDIRNTLSKFENLKISYYLVNTILILIKENQKKLFHLLDLEKNIEATMNDFHMEDIEKIILNIIHNELKWINIFGGIIGFLIGIIQTILAFFII